MSMEYIHFRLKLDLKNWIIRIMLILCTGSKEKKMAMKTESGAGVMARWLRTSTSLVQDLNLVTSTHTGQLTT